MINDSEKVLLNAAESSKGDPCTPEAHTAVVNLGVITFKKVDAIYDCVKKNKITTPKTIKEALLLFIVKSPAWFAVIVVSVVCWFMYSDVHPKDILPIAEKAAVEVVNTGE